MTHLLHNTDRVHIEALRGEFTDAGKIRDTRALSAHPGGLEIRRACR
jgi:hypothetical protein